LRYSSANFFITASRAGVVLLTRDDRRHRSTSGARTPKR
jgi:hypothetical protein